MDVIITEDICEAGSQCVITTWLFDDGDPVEQGTPIVEIMLEKAQLELDAPASGTLRIKVQPEQPLTQGDVIAIIE